VVEYLAVPLQALAVVGFLVAECLVVALLQAQVVVAFLGLECLVVPLLGLVVVAFLAEECQNPVCLAVLSLVLVKMLVELDLAAHKMSRVQLEL
jgi:hypothetical protein